MIFINIHHFQHYDHQIHRPSFSFRDQQSVRYYLSYKLSYREIEEILAEHGINVDHSTLNRWVLKYAPLLEHRARRRKKPVASS